MRLRGCVSTFAASWAYCMALRALTRSDSFDTVPTVIQTGRNISIVGDNFIINGQPFHIMSGSLHYFRVPSEYWKDRLHKLKAAGLNSVATYVEWSFHETEERQYSFEGDRDLAAFLRLAAEEGLHVLLRPGPYICAERDLGGLPYWLLGKYPKIRLRTTDSDFMTETKIWMKKLFAQVSPLLFGNGGPIILVQVENEYGSHGHDMAYKIQLRDIIKEHVGDKALLYTTDGTSPNMTRGGAVPGALTTVDFGHGMFRFITIIRLKCPHCRSFVGNVTSKFATLRSIMPTGPLMNSEYYAGWMTHWGEALHQKDTNLVVATLTDMLNHSINFNVYVFFGGTNFEFTAGANYGKSYLPDITSYDYDAPLSEAGDPTTKYFKMRDAIAKYNPQVTSIDPPTPAGKGSYGTITLNRRFGLLSPEGRSSLGKKYPHVSGSKLPTFEQLRQRSGLMLYEITVGESNGLLHIAEPRDRIYVYVDGKFQVILCRTHKLYSLHLITKTNSVLSLLVENQGRINYGPHLHDYKGILSTVTYNGGTILNGTWSVTGFPLEKLDSITTSYVNQNGDIHEPVKEIALYDGYFSITEQQPLDTFLDPTGWGKGYIWVNGHNLGRYWPGTGPQVTLYVPACWLRAAPAQNYVQVLELEQAPSTPTLNSIDYPIMNRTAGAAG